jgi:hypothetical protein
MRWYEAAGTGIQDQVCFESREHEQVCRKASGRVRRENKDYLASLEKRKIYIALRDEPL